MLYVLAFPRLADADIERVEAFRLKHEPQRAQLVGAHVTLVFGLPNEAEGALLQRTAAVAGEAAEFPVLLDRAEMQDGRDGERHLFLMVGQGADRLMELYRWLNAGLTPPSGMPAFQPHVTVAASSSRTAIEAAHSDVARLHLPIAARIDALVVAVLADSTLTQLARLKLRAADGEQ